MTPYFQWDGRIRCDARHLPLAAESVQCVVTSPPYWGLRDYGNPGQLGLERTPGEYVESMLQVFREVWRVLKADGTLWLNLGDSYCNVDKWGGGGQNSGKHTVDENGDVPSWAVRNRRQPYGLKPKDLVGIPWRVAFALQADGWYLRSDIIWHKPNPMPESVQDRPTRAHEYIFLLTKSERYFYDVEAIKESSSSAPVMPWKDRKAQGEASRHGGSHNAPTLNRGDKQRGHGRRHEGFNARWDAMSKSEQGLRGRNKRSVWTVGTQAYAEAHYATFPPALIEPCILAGSRPGDMILDPFAGSNTTGMVAEKLGRRWIACDLGYQDLQKKRLTNVQRELVAL